jgi:L-ascorbate metabolism protein UlaG (beta-lactamase superfamily)
MMTRREAQQRAAVNNAHINVKVHNGTTVYAAIHDNWTHKDRQTYAAWREDIEDAVLDCGKLVHHG